MSQEMRRRNGWASGRAEATSSPAMSPKKVSRSEGSSLARPIVPSSHCSDALAASLHATFTRRGYVQ